MKIWITIIVGGLLMVLLTVRALYRKGTGMDGERDWYLSQLDYNFYGRIDRVKVNSESSKLRFHVTGGAFNPDVENKLNMDLKYHGAMRFLSNAGEKVEIQYFRLSNISEGDSIHVDTDKNSIRIFHGDSLISQQQAIWSLVGRPF